MFRCCFIPSCCHHLLRGEEWPSHSIEIARSNSVKSLAHRGCEIANRVAVSSTDGGCEPASGVVLSAADRRGPAACLCSCGGLARRVNVCSKLSKKEKNTSTS